MFWPRLSPRAFIGLRVLWLDSDCRKHGVTVRGKFAGASHHTPGNREHCCWAHPPRPGMRKGACQARRHLSVWGRLKPAAAYGIAASRIAVGARILADRKARGAGRAIPAGQAPHRIMRRWLHACGFTPLARPAYALSRLSHTAGKGNGTVSGTRQGEPARGLL
jgi:hypothetical protein